MASRSEKLAKLEEQQRRLREREQKLQAHMQRLKAAQAKDERRKDTRRKILVGSMVLSQAQRGQRSKEQLLRELDAYLTQERDRELFGLTTEAADESAPENAHAAQEPAQPAPALSAHA